MRYLSILIVSFAMVLSIRAQERGYSYLSGEIVSNTPKSLPESLIKTDLNGDTISVIIVRSDLNDLSFYGNVYGEPVKTKTAEGIEYVLNLTEGSRNLKIRSNDYHQADINFPKAIGSKELWEINITGIEAPQVSTVEVNDVDYSHNVRIAIEPFAELFIDETFSPKTDSISLEEGTHYITSKYRNYKYNQKVNVKKEDLDIDARLGGTVIVKNSADIKFHAIQGSEAVRKKITSHGNVFEFGDMVGRYIMEGTPNTISRRSVKKEIEVTPRSRHLYIIDEMVPYGFIFYHGTNVQPFGFNIAICKRFGIFASYSSDAKIKVKTKYGEIKFIESDSNSESISPRTTSMTLSAGPMVRFWHKMYLQVGIGWAHYLSTSEPKILTADYKYKSGLSANAEFIFRIKAFAMGVGYMRQFAKEAYNPNISNQLTISIGMAFGL